LLALLCSLAGCWNSHAKQESAGGSSSQAVDSATAPEPSPQKAADSATAANTPGKSTDSAMGFTHTWKPDSQATKPTAAPPVVPSAPADNDRYANSSPAPGVVAHTEMPDTPAYPVKPLPPKQEQAKTEPVAPAPAAPDNPLRNANQPGASGRPETPAAPDPAPAPITSTPPGPAMPAPAPQQPPPKSELTISTQPEQPAAPPKAPDVPATPIGPTLPAGAPGTPGRAAPATEPKSQPKEQPKEPSAESVRPGPRTNKNSGIPFDPIKENGPIFVGWPKPKLALVITGQQAGYLEPCGCAGLDRMKGGMSRRYSLFRMLRDKGWPVIGMDVGGTAKGFGKQAEIKFQIAVNSMNAMRYNSAALGFSDLQLPTEEVLSQVMPVNAEAKTMFVSGNVGLFKFEEAMLPRTQLISTGYKMLGVTAVLGKKYQDKLAGNPNLKMISAGHLLDEAMPLLKSRAGYLVLLAHATRDEAVELGKKYPDFNLIVCAGEAGFSSAEPPAQAEDIRKGGTKLIEVGEKGEYAVVIGLFDDPQEPVRYQRVTLDSRFPSSPEMVALMTAYQEQLKDMGLSGLGIRPLQHPLKESNGEYVGSEACQNCHEESYRIWKKTPHSHAFATLKTATPPRNFDPECISCHTVGWNPAKFFPYQSGYLSEKETPKLINMGCENCHGPGQKHIWAENHGTPAEQVAARKTVVLTKEEAADPNSRKQNCWSCHDLDNSPEFKFELYWPFVKHYERE